MKNITILGSTGSIGTQTLDVIRNNMDRFKVKAISANSNIELLSMQVKEFNPEYVVIMSQERAKLLKEKINDSNVKVLVGMEGLEYISTLDDVDVVLTSVVGMVGLRPTLAAIKSNKIIALANKETLVAGGELIKKELKLSKAKILPVDSEHSAIYQCLVGEEKENIKRVIVTASGGPFRGKSKDELLDVTPEMAVKHPKWNMGKKISIDSATLMNKALEVIEAHFLFDVDYDKIDVAVHPQSIVHSMVEYKDGSIKAQIGNTDMRHPIQYALDYPNRKVSSSGYLDIFSMGELTFERPDMENFECLKLGYKAAKIGGTMTSVLNAANEEAVKLFLDKKIKFLDIPNIVSKSMSNHNVRYEYSLDDILQIEMATREFVNSLLK